MLNKYEKIIKNFLFFIILLAASMVIFSALNTLFNPKADVNGVDKTQEKTKLRKVLEVGLVILVIILVVMSLVVGYMRIYKSDKKKYIKVAKEMSDEYKLEFDDDVYYLKKKDLNK